MKLSELKAQLRSLGLSSTGRKEILIERLRDYLRKAHENEATDNKSKNQPQTTQQHDFHHHHHQKEQQQQQNKHDEHEVHEAYEAPKIMPSSVTEISKTAKTTSGTSVMTAISSQYCSTMKKNDSPPSPSSSPTPTQSQSTLELPTSSSSSTLLQTPDDEKLQNYKKTSVQTLDSSTEASKNLLLDCRANINKSNNTHSMPAKVDINHSRVKYELVASREDNDVTVEYIQGLPHFTVPLPSRQEKCLFVLKPVSHKVGDLIAMLKMEDRGIDRATILNKDGVRIASTVNIQALLDEPFWLYINDQKYKVVPPKQEKISGEDLNTLGDIRSLVAQLYEALHVGEYHIHKEQEMTAKLEDLKYQLQPLEARKAELSAQAERRTSILTWVGLGLMGVQFGVLARLTWWEYSWDIMEPVTYFVTYGTAMAMYAYFCITKQDYNLPDVKDRQYLLTMHKRAKEKNFDIDRYNQLKRQVSEIEYDLRRLRDPLNLQLPPHVDRAQQRPLPRESTTAEATTQPTNVLTKKIAESKKSGFKLFLDTKD